MKLKILIFMILLPGLLAGQTVLDEYIRYGLENNLALQQKMSSYNKSIEALKEARGLFYPDLSFNSRYTLSEGGRVIEFPVGDLLNPVYSTLNMLTATTSFPVLGNQEIRFLRPTEQETKLRMIQPVINPDIYYNSKIKRELSLLEEDNINQYKRELISDIKKSYYSVAAADGILSMLIKTRDLLIENVRVNRKLIENDKVTLDYLYRSETELSKFEQEVQNAEKNRRIAIAYFNFLLNKPLQDSVLIVTSEIFPVIPDYSADYARIAIENREELSKLNTLSDISGLQVKMNKSGKLPDVFIAVDYGFEGTEYRFNKDRDYIQASAVLSWNLFSGFQNRSRIKQAMYDREMAERKYDEAREQIALQVTTVMSELLSAEKGISAAEARVKSAREGFRLVNRRYEEGQASLLEFIDARTTLTQAEENLIISRLNYLSSYAEFEKVTSINHNENIINSDN